MCRPSLLYLITNGPFLFVWSEKYRAVQNKDTPPEFREVITVRKSFVLLETMSVEGKSHYWWRRQPSLAYLDASFIDGWRIAVCSNCIVCPIGLYYCNDTVNKAPWPLLDKMSKIKKLPNYCRLSCKHRPVSSSMCLAHCNTLSYTVKIILIPL